MSSFKGSVGRQNEKRKEIPLVEGHGGTFDRLDDSAAASKRNMSMDVYAIDAV